MDPAVNPYPNVHSRVYEPARDRRAAPNFRQMLPPKPTFPKNPQFANVTSKYAEKPDNTPRKPREVPPSPFLDKKEHDQLSARIIGRVSAKFFDPQAYQVDENSPRRRVEEKIIRDERLHNWRTDTVTARNRCFDDYKRATEKRWENLPKRKKTTQNSQVMDYVRNGSPIRHHKMSHMTEHGNSAAIALQQRRAGTPPSRLWHAPGPSEYNFGEYTRKTEIANKSFSLEQRKVEEKAARRNGKVVERNHVPRVAMLAPSVVVSQAMSRAGSTAPGSHPREEYQQQHVYEIEDGPTDEAGRETPQSQISGRIHFTRK